MCDLCDKTRQKVVKMAVKAVAKGLSMATRIKEAQVIVAKAKDAVASQKEQQIKAQQDLAVLIAQKKAGKK
jgi:outer membrane protein TolC